MVSFRLWITVSIVIVLLLGLQALPFARNQTNPPILNEPDWDSPMTRHLAKRACFDCHSNETNWPWYAGFAPISWFIQHNVEEGREVLNFSEWNKYSRDDKFKNVLAAAFDEVMLRNAMPPMNYLLLHPVADLAIADRDRLLQGLKLTVKGKK